MPRRTLVPALALGIAASTLLAGPAAARSYRAYDLGELLPAAVNAKNQVAGRVPAPQPGGAGGSYAAVWADGGLRQLLPVLGSRSDANQAAAYDIADNGTVVGVSPVTTSSPWRAVPVVWPSGSGPARDVGGGDGGYMLAISPSGASAVGWHYTNVGQQPPVALRVTIAGGTATPGGFPGAPLLVDVNDAGDLIGVDASAAQDPYTLFRGAAEIVLDQTTAAHPLGADGSVVMVDLPGTSEILIRRQDGTLVRTGAFVSASATEPMHGVTARAVQNGAFVGDQVGGFGQPYVQRAVLWKAGELIDLTPFVPRIDGVAPRQTQAVDLSTKGAIVGFSTHTRAGEATATRRGWLLVLQVRITGQVVEPGTAAAPVGAGRAGVGRAAPRPRANVVVRLAPSGGAAITVRTNAQGRFTADVPPGTVAITLPGRSGCVTAACATTTTIDVQDDLALAIRLDPTTKPVVPTLPRGAIRVKRGAVPLTLRCRLVSAPCRITATVKTARKVLATAVVTVKAGRTATRALPLTRAGKAALAGGATVRATLVLATRTPTARRATSTFGVRLRR